MLIQGMFGKTALLKVLEHSQKKIFSKGTFKLSVKLFNLSSFYVILPAQSCPA